MKTLKKKMWVTTFANDNDAFIPEVWAEESLIQLENNMIAGNLVHRDFEDEIREFGDVVNTRRPSDFVARRKTDDDNVTVQDAQSTNVQVPLDQWFHTSFSIKDGEMSKSFEDLASTYIVPAARSLAQAIDEVVVMQQYRFLANVVGRLGTAPTKASMIALREKLTTNQCPMVGRSLLVGPLMEGDLLGNDSFTNANEVGDQGEAMSEGSLGRKYGFQTYMDQNCPTIVSAPTASQVTTADALAGATLLEVDSGPAFEVGQWIVAAGDNTPQRITGIATNDLTITPGLRTAVISGAAVSGFDQGAVDLGAGYAEKWSKGIVMDAFTRTPAKGQLVTFANSPTKHYGLMTGSTELLAYLDRPVEDALVNDEVVSLGPQGNYGFGFHRNAIALVTRPLIRPPSISGAASAVADFNNLSIRVTMQYQGLSQGMLVTLDILAGVAVLDARLGAVLLG